MSGGKPAHGDARWLTLVGADASPAAPTAADEAGQLLGASVCMARVAVNQLALPLHNAELMLTQLAHLQTVKPGVRDRCRQLALIIAREAEAIATLNETAP